MGIDVVGPVLGVVLEHEDRRRAPEPAAADRLDQPAERDVVLGHHRPRRRRIGPRAIGVIVTQPDDVEARQPAVGLELSRSGSRSTFGEVRVLKAGIKEPVAIQRAVAVYTEVNSRHVAIPLNDAFKGDISGPVTVQYVETYDDGAQTIAETRAVLR